MALAITSFPVPVSPWIRTAESTGATLSTSVSNARNFGLDPIKSKVVMALLPLCVLDLFRYCSDQANMGLASLVMNRDPLADVWIAISQLNAGGFASSQKSDAILTG